MNVELYEKIRATLPDDFALIDDEKKGKYFRKLKADYIFMQEEKKVVATFLRTETPLTDDKVEQQIAAYQQYYSRMAPGYIPVDTRISNASGRNIAFMSYKSNAPAKDLYTMLAVTTLDNQELLIIFMCDLPVAVNYLHKFLRILDSLEFMAPTANEA